MKNKLLMILTWSSVLSLIGFLMDGDAKEPSMLMRFVEFFGVVGVLFIVMSSIYFSSVFAYKKLQKA